MAISFNFQDVQKPVFFKAGKIKSWLKNIAEKENFVLKELHYIFLDDIAILKINVDYLGHDTYTDIITFDNSEKQGNMEGDIFISLERVEANAKKYKVSLEHELHRVMAHGLLHLCGYKDKKKKDIEVMRKKEEEYLQLYYRHRERNEV
ncbi:MAG: ybeY [Bacteroidota bacterium]|nr:ybeY [Bacteroidota bacterium]